MTCKNDDGVERTLPTCGQVSTNRPEKETSFCLVWEIRRKYNTTVVVVVVYDKFSVGVYWTAAERGDRLLDIGR